MSVYRYTLTLLGALVIAANSWSDIGDPIGSYAYAINTVSVVDVDGERRLIVECSGAAEEYEQVLATATFHNVDSDQRSGTAIWRAVGFRKGEMITDTAVGIWSLESPHRWRFRAISNVSDGEIFAGDGIVDTAAKTFKGTMLEWK